MIQRTFSGIAATIAVLAASAVTAQAQDGTPVKTIVVHQPPRVFRPASNTTQARPVSAAAAAEPATVSMYPQTNASLYPSPQPNVPYQVGGTAITNQALAPHEFLYPHTYRAVYPPYYYKVDGCWVCYPFGSSTHERWKLVGTQVEVKYNPKISKFSRFVPPMRGWR